MSGIWDLSALIKNGTCAPCSGSMVLTTGPPGKSCGCYFGCLLVVMCLEVQDGSVCLLDTSQNSPPFIQIFKFQLILIDLLCVGQCLRHQDVEVDK